ncbi:hypothetical protein ACWIID_11180 [Streptomyces phaeochromogenes]
MSGRRARRPYARVVAFVHSRLPPVLTAVTSPFCRTKYSVSPTSEGSTASPGIARRSATRRFAPLSGSMNTRAV